ncbi:hypothetical protein GCM10023100_64580 [Actinocorallia cavernae]|uniref:Uncharacterized protein n=2 Tax=Actinomycetes TaxID=1760 RepID=A0ABN3N1U7_9ACTN
MVQPAPEARPEPVGPWALLDWPPFWPAEPVAPDPVEPVEPVELLEPPEPWAPEVSEAALLGEEESPPPELLSLPPQAVSDRPAATATASSEIFWTRMIPLKRYG